LTIPLDPLIRLGRENERLKIANADLRSMNRKLTRRGGGFAVDEMMEELRDFLVEEKQTPFNLSPKTYGKMPLLAEPPFDKDHHEYAATMWSDWHISEVVRGQDANNVNEYNSIIAANRVASIVDKTKKIITGHSCLYKMDGIWLLILGDMLNGSIHPELALTNDLTDPAATILAARLIQMGIEELKTLNLPIDVDCIVGNHPRITLKMPTKRQAHLSMDWVVYEMLSNAFAKDDQVRFNVHTSQIAMTEIYGWRYVLEHGIDVKSGGEEAFEDRLRALFDDGTYRKAAGLKGTSFDQICIGNMHKPKMLERVLVNGSLTGQNELGVSWRLKMIRAQQMLWGISPSNSRTWVYPLDVTNIKSEKPDNSFSEFTKWFMKRHGR
jgi:hypothetical protein